MGGWRRKIKKRNIGSHIWNSFFENIISGMQLFYIRQHVPVEIVSFFFNFKFSSGKCQSQHKLAKNHSFYNTGLFKNLTHFTNFNSLDTENNMLQQHSQKPVWLYKFSSKHVSVWWQKKTFALHHFLTPKDCILDAFWTEMSVYFCLRKKLFVPET